MTLPTTLIVDRMPTVGQANYGLADARTFAPLTAAALNGFLAQVQPGDYVALQAYVESTAETDAVLRMLRAQLRDYLKLATTVGYGPYLLHSTGRLHKSDAGQDVAIPKEADQ